MRNGQIVQLCLLSVAILFTAVAIVVITRTILVHPLKPEYYCDGEQQQQQQHQRQHRETQPSAKHHQILPSALMFERFQKALTFRTITTKPKHYDKQQLADFIDFIQKSKYF